jgi:hypothetical protein
MAKTTSKTIAHALFWYTDPDDEKRERTALRGQTVDLLDADVARGEAAGAFTAEVGDEPDAPTDSRMAPLPESPTDVEYDAYVDAAKVDEVLNWASEHPEHRKGLGDAESRRGDKARTTLIEGLAKLAGQA